MAGEYEDDFPPIEEDRDFPDAQGPSNSQFIFGLILLAVAVLAIWFLFFNKPNEAPETLTTANSEIEYSGNQRTPPPIAPRPRIEAPVFPAPQAPVKAAAPTPKTYDPLAAQRRKEALELEKARLEAERKRMQERLYSKQLIIDSSSLGFGGGGNTGVPTDRAARERLATDPVALRRLAEASGQGGNTGSPLGSANARTDDGEFFDEVANSGIPTAQAVRIQRLDKTLPQGTVIKGVLETAVNSDLPGMMRAIATEHTYSFDGSEVLIPKGSRLIGRYNSGVKAGQTRIFVIWERVIRPDGLSVKVNSPGTDELGTAGLGGDVDSHFFKRYGSAILLSVIEGAIDYAVAEAQDGNSSVIAIGGAGDNVETLANASLQRNLNIPPTIHVDQGTRINIFVSQDLSFVE